MKRVFYLIFAMILITINNVSADTFFQIPLSKGWNLISSNSLPFEPSLMDSMFKSIIEKVIIVKNNNGNAFIPQYKINDIGNWDITQGYQVYMTDSVTLTIYAAAVNPLQTPIKLDQGWNMVAYLRDTELDCEIAFASISDNGNLVVVKDNDGKVYVPQYGINNIGNLIPGKGYQIYVTNSDTLIYPENTTVTIGSQAWAKKNLDVAFYRNGDTIPQVTDPTQWANLTTGAWCYYNNDSANGIIYGKLYNWYAVNDPRGLAPQGYHIPSIAESEVLSNYLGGSDNSGGKMKESGYTHWNSPNTGASNSSGFNALPSGYREFNGDYTNIGNYCLIWSANEYDGTFANYSSLFYNQPGYYFFQTNYYKVCGFTVRCIKDAPTIEEVTIGTQTWTKKNLDVAYYNNGDTIPQVTDPNEWKNLRTGAWCYVENNPTLGAVYGKLYNWYAVNDPRGLAPKGYHIPVDSELVVLTDYLGGLSVAGGKLKETGSKHWYSPNVGATNSSGFTGLGSGLRFLNGSFNTVTGNTGWWSATELDGHRVARTLYLLNSETRSFLAYWDTVTGASIRCIKN